MSSDPISITSPNLLERGNLLEYAVDETDNAAVKKPAPKAPERVKDPAELADLVHHLGDKVCDVELVPVRKRKLHNVLTRMRDERLRGPLGVMRRCMTENTKVKVITRNYKHVRGICTGYILAFDKHWNLALKDVDEVYKNPLPKPTAKRKKRQRTAKEKMSEAVRDGRELLQIEKPKATTAKVESATDLLHSDFNIATSPRAEDDADNCQELQGKSSTPVELLKKERKRILERLQELSCAENSSSEYEENEVENPMRCSDVALRKENSSFVSRHERHSSTSSATGSRLSKRSKTSGSKKSYEPNKWRGSRTDDSDLSVRDRDLRDSEHQTIQTSVRGRSSAQSQAKLKGMSTVHSRHCEHIYPVKRDTEGDEDFEGVDQSNLAQNNRKDCDESQNMWQPWLVRHVNQLFIRGDNVVLVSVTGT